MDEIDLNELLQLIIKDKGGSPQQYNQLMDYVAFHETGHEQRMDPKARQITDSGKKDGVGRGLFMFEAGEGKGGNAAANRLHNYFQSVGADSPKWLLNIKGLNKNVDATKLTADQQKMLFLGNHRMRTESNFSNIWSGEQSYGDFWQKDHWVGLSDATEEQKQAKLDLFNKSMLAKDSTDALRAKEEELMYKQNMAPHLSDSNNINKLPQINDILKGIFGAQDSSLIKEYNHGGVHLPVAESDATYVQQPQFNIPVAQEEQYIDQFGNTGGSLYPSGPEPTFWNKAVNTAANPLGTFGYSARGEDIPWGNVPRHGNAFDSFALGMVNPAAWLESGQASQAAFDKGDYLGAGLEGLGVLPYVGTASHLGKKFAPQTSALLRKMGLGPKQKLPEYTTAKELMEEFTPIPTSTGNINKYHNGVQDVVQKRKDYLLSDEYITKRAANTGESANQIKAQTDLYLKELDKTTLSMYSKGDLGKGTSGTYSKKGIEIEGDRPFKNILEDIDHEVGHLLSPILKSSKNPHTNVLWKDKKTGKILTDAEAQVHKTDLDVLENPKWTAWEKKQRNLYKDYPVIKMSAGDSRFTNYLNDPAEQQVRMVRYGEILKKQGWDGTKKGLTNKIIDKSTAEGWLGSSDLPSDIIQLLGKMKGIKPGSPEWYAQIKKTLPYAWGMAPVAATTFNTKDSSLVKEYDDGGVHLPVDEKEEDKKSFSSKMDNWFKSLGTSEPGGIINVFETIKNNFTSNQSDEAIKIMIENEQRKHGTKKDGMVWDASIVEDKTGRHLFGDWVPEQTVPKEEIPDVPSPYSEKKRQKFTPIESIQAQQLSVDDSMSLAEAGIPIDTDKYKYSKYYDNRRKEYRVRVIDKSKKGKSKDIQEVDNLSLEQFNIYYKYKR